MHATEAIVFSASQFPPGGVAKYDNPGSRGVKDTDGYTRLSENANTTDYYVMTFSKGPESYRMDFYENGLVNRKTGTRCFVQFWEPVRYNTIERYNGSICNGVFSNFSTY